MGATSRDGPPRRSILSTLCLAAYRPLQGAGPVERQGTIDSNVYWSATSRPDGTLPSQTNRPGVWRPQPGPVRDTLPAEQTRQPFLPLAYVSPCRRFGTPAYSIMAFSLASGLQAPGAWKDLLLFAFITGFALRFLRRTPGPQVRTFTSIPPWLTPPPPCGRWHQTGRCRFRFPSLRAAT